MASTRCAAWELLPLFESFFGNATRVLVSHRERSVSIVLMMRSFPHVTQVGGTTRGGPSSLLPKPFPNGFMVTLSYQRVLDVQGRSYEGSGIAPARELELFPDNALTEGVAAVLKQLAAETD